MKFLIRFTRHLFTFNGSFSSNQIKGLQIMNKGPCELGRSFNCRVLLRDFTDLMIVV